MTSANTYRLFHLKIVPDDRPNADGRWIERVVPDTWPGDDKAQPHMLKEPPVHDTVPLPGYHIVQIEEATPGPSNQPGLMWQAPDPVGSREREEDPEEPDQPAAPGM